jgi:hypothetical protein
VILRQTEQQHLNKETYQALPLLLYLLGVPYHIIIHRTMCIISYFSVFGAWLF